MWRMQAKQQQNEFDLTHFKMMMVVLTPIGVKLLALPPSSYHFAMC